MILNILYGLNYFIVFCKLYPLLRAWFNNKLNSPVFHLPVIRHTFAEHSIRFCLIHLSSKATRSTIIMEMVDTDPYPSFKSYMKEQIFDSYQKECIIINCPVCR